MGSEMEAMVLDQEAEWACGDAAEDQFDRLPDAVLLDVFNRIGDVKALGRCALVSRRFHDLVPLVDSVFVRVDCVIPDDLPQPSAGSPQRLAGARPDPLPRLGGRLQALGAAADLLPPADVSHYSLSEFLRAFKELRRLPIELPTGELGIEDGVLLKWKADFGSTLGSCVILGASSISSKPLSPATTPEAASDRRSRGPS